MFPLIHSFIHSIYLFSTSYMPVSVVGPERYSTEQNKIPALMEFTWGVTDNCVTSVRG